MSAHTPGPWRAWTDRIGLPVVTDTGLNIADCYQISTGTGLANARLIAAAPEMLDAPRDVIEHMEWSTGRGEAAYQCARAALAKATGGAA